MKFARAVACIIALLGGCQNESPPHVPPPPVTAAAEITTGASLAARCSACHGADGISRKKGVPFLAGQQAQYLAGALHTYANGTRKHEAMKTAVQTLSEEEIAALVAYYSQLRRPWKGAEAPPAPKVRRFDSATVAVGQSASRPCDSCHGTDGNSTRAGVPSLAGLQPEYFSKALNAYFTGARSDPIMNVFKESLDKQEIKTMAAYYATQQRGKTRFLSKGKAEAGKLKASACNGCHGADGNSINPDVPGLAGQNGPYLENVLLAYRNGTRKDGLMQATVANLTVQDLRDLAAYFASQEPVTPQTPNADTSGKFDPLGDGARLARNCDGCHGSQGNSTTPGIPSLNRLHSDYLANTIKAYRDGGRNNPAMKNFVLNLSDADIVKIALYYATQEPAVNPVQAKGDAAAGEKLASACNVCHGERGNSPDPRIPALAGQDPAYLAVAVKKYAGGARTHVDMQNAVKDLKDNELNDIAAYFAAQPSVKLRVHLPEAPEVLAEQCNRCHGENGRSTEPTKPRLNGQVESYLAHALRSYKNGVRDNTMMHAMSDVLSDLEIDALAAHYARQP